MSLDGPLFGSGRPTAPRRAAAPRALAALAAAALLAAPAEPAACPDCPAARAARVEVFDQDFGRNLLTALAPFLVLAVVAAAAHRAKGSAS